MRSPLDSDAHRNLRVMITLCMILLFGPHAVAADDSTTTTPAAAGMRIYRDPTTGTFTAPPPGTVLPPSARALGTSAQGLVETPGTSAAGGVTLNLGGRFQSAISATAADAGPVHTGCHMDARVGAAK